MRFIAIQEPTDYWMVYDLVSELPAEIAGRVLIGLARDEAEMLVWRLQTPAGRQRLAVPTPAPWRIAV